MATSAKWKIRDDLFSGGNGASPETAIIIGAATNAIGMPAEYAYVMEKHGLPHVGRMQPHFSKKPLPSILANPPGLQAIRVKRIVYPWSSSN